MRDETWEGRGHGLDRHNRSMTIGIASSAAPRRIGALLSIAASACGPTSSARPATPAASPTSSVAARPSAPVFTTPLEPIAAEAGGVVGVGILHVESGQRVSMRGGERFPMASVYKLPIAIAFLRRVDTGQASLEEKISYEPSDLRPGLAGSAINARARSGAATAAARELLSAMLIESDNTASDLILRLAGGPEAVMAGLRQAGVEGVDVSRPEGRMLLDYWGVASPPPPSEWSLATFGRLRGTLTAGQRRAAAERFASDPRDTATPDAMAMLLARLRKGELLSPASTAFVIDTMARATTGPGRLKGLLPAGTVVAHKTGTGGDTAGVNCCTNDAGIVTLPGGEHLAIAVFVRSSGRPTAARERAIARIAEAAYRHWAPPKAR